MAVHYVAGALHGDPMESYGYAWGGARWNGEADRWEVGWAPRIYVAERQSAVADRTRYPELDEDDFAWEPLALGWGAPGSAAE